MKAKWLAPIAILLVIGVYTVNLNNTLVEKEESLTQAWAQVENQYQRRADLIPNLVSTVRGAANFEQETLTAVIEARSQASRTTINASQLADADAFATFQNAQDQLGGALSRLLVTVERYPELRATQNFRDLQVQLEGTENRITTERMRYNQTAQEFNTSIRRFPARLLADILGFERKAYFQAVEGAEVAPTISFD